VIRQNYLQNIVFFSFPQDGVPLGQRLSAVNHARRQAQALSLAARQRGHIGLGGEARDLWL